MALFVLLTTIAAIIQLAAGACSPGTIASLLVETSQTSYIANNTVHLNSITVKTADASSSFINTGVADIRIRAPGHIQATFGTATTLTSAAGIVTFTGITLNNPPRGTFFFELDLMCTSPAVDRTDKLEITVISGSPASVRFYVAPEASITNYGVFTVRPQMAYYDLAGNIADMANYDTWTLTTNDTTLNAQMIGNTFTPSMTTGPIVTFNDLYFTIQPSATWTGKVFELYLQSIGSDTGMARNITFPGRRVIKIADCQNDFTIVPTSTGASPGHFITPKPASGSYAELSLRGYNFPSAAATFGGCKWGGDAVPMVYYDVCNIGCQLPLHMGQYKMLSLSIHGISYEDVAPAAVVDTAHHLLIEPQNITVHRQSHIFTSFHVSIADIHGVATGDQVTSVGTHRVSCHSHSPFANQKLIRGPYFDPFTQSTRSPNYHPTLVKGNATLELAFQNSLEAEVHRFCCNVSASLPVKQTCLNIKVVEDCVAPPVVSSIHTAACTGSWDGHLTGCKTGGQIPLTIIGANFGPDGARVRVGPRYCDATAHDPQAPTRVLVATGCQGRGLNHTVTVIRPAEKVYGNWAKQYNFGAVPVVTSIVGCASNFFPSTANCNPAGTDMVQINGKNFGGSGAEVRFYYDQPSGSPYFNASTVIHVDPAGTKINATNFPGLGVKYGIGIYTSDGELVIERGVTMSFVASAYVACPKVSNIQCNARGNCDNSIGVCACFGDATDGFWTGLDCSSCQPGYYGADCKLQCPQSSSLTCGGLTRGTCFDGQTGNGTCQCAAGRAGLACETDCPGGVSSPCSGHGACNQPAATCNCYFDATNGYWTGSDCSSCDTMYVGSSCTQLCPTATSGTPCTGNGTCASTATAATCQCQANSCGSDCNIYNWTGTECGPCDFGKWGATCQYFCPGYDASTPHVCSGHGSCNGDKGGDGLCICDTGYGGAACNIACPKSGGLACSGTSQGTCNTVTGVCTCKPNFAGSDCSITCVTGTGVGATSATTCSSQGTCNDGASGDGTCACAFGFTLTDCSKECPGPNGSPCSNHGQCFQNDTCGCYHDDARGYWVGAICDKCAPDWYGNNCNQTCPKVGGAQCASRGTCQTVTGTNLVECKCFDDLQNGHWGPPDCGNCLANYYGAACTMQCPGGSCNACSKNGKCSDGLAGNGTCTCYTNSSHGHWKGEKCDSCAASYFGQKCTSKCPFANGVVCGGHGQCFDGIRGNGTCGCIRSDILGYWGGSACEACLTGYLGATCLDQCPGTDAAAGTTCSDHGTCNTDGTCTCDTGFGASDCSSGCALVENSTTLYCGKDSQSHGVCLDGATRNGTCQCDQSDGSGYWAGVNCTECLYGYWGTSCTSRCPLAWGEVCGGPSRGTCDSATGTCSCVYGWAGPKCARACDGGHRNPCGGHGVCDATTGHCACDNDAVKGYWGGRNCSSCAPLYSGKGLCTTLCPNTEENPTVACNGHGFCVAGKCKGHCTEGWCGDKCQIHPNDCTTNCPTTTRWGPLCDQLCPGDGTCSGNGKCSHGKEGTGECDCDSGFWGDGCAEECPGGAATPCTGKGKCDTSGACTCIDGWATADCSQECPGGASNPCMGNGTCSRLAGTCTCFQGYAGLDCGAECPGNKTCSYHGTCVQDPPSCKCDADETNGYWDGTDCDRCQPGYHGESCLQVCRNGHTEGKLCICDEPWSGADCSIACPGDPTGTQNASRCSGHGKCKWGNDNLEAGCTCDTDYFKADCSKFCTTSMCAAHPFYLVNGQCNNATGECSCIDNDVDGHWSNTATRCTTCRLFYFGDKCERRCPCLQHGGCDKTTGACQCFDDDSRGHWTGTSCEKCKTGFLGARCTGKDVVITRQKPCSSLAFITSSSAFILVDKAYDLVMTGGKPIVVCNLTTRAFINTYDGFDGSVVAGRIHDANNIILTLGNFAGNSTDPSLQQTIRIRREANPSFAVEGVGAKYLTAAANVTTKPTTHGMKALAEGTDSAALTRRFNAASSTGRQLTTVHQYHYDVTVANILVSGDEYLTVMSNGVVTRTIGLTVDSQYNFGDYFDQVLCADVTSTILISPSLLLLGGEQGGTFQLIAIPLPLSTATVANIQNLSSTITAATTYCENGNCKAVAKIVADGTFFVLAMMTNRYDTAEQRNFAGAGIVRFRYTQLFSGGRVESNAVLDNYDSTTVINVTAMLLDPLGSAGFVAMNLKSPDTEEPSTIYKFDLLDLQVYGSVRFQRVVDTFEIVTSLVKDDDARILFATVPLQSQINVVPLNLYAVTKVYPAIADTAGGTVITVEGEGFINDNTLYCNFNGTLVRATFISSREAKCVAPVGGDERCEGVPLEITIRADQWTKNETPLRRVSSARITKIQNKNFLAEGVDNAYGNLTGGNVVVLNGLGFQDSSHLACRFTSTEGGETQYAHYADRDYAYSLGKQGVLYNKARFVNATRMECDQPEFRNPTKGKSSLEVTLDGTVYSRTGLSYDVIAAAQGLSTFRLKDKNDLASWERDIGTTYQSGERVPFDDINVFVVDAVDQRLRSLDTLSRNIEMKLTTFKKQSLGVGNATQRTDCDRPFNIQDPPVLHTDGARSVISKNGRATFSGMYLLKPPSGTYVLTFTDTTTGWSFNHVITINVGPAFKIKICKEPSLLTKNTNPTLTRQPELYLEDIAGNQLPTSALSGIRVEANYWSELTRTTAVAASDQKAKRRLGVPVSVERTRTLEVHVGKLQDNFIVFEGLEMTGLFGSTYAINFTAPQHPHILNVTSRAVGIDDCGKPPANAGPNVLTYFAKPGTSECFLCPDAGECDGTDKVQVKQTNYWRPSQQSYRFYSCAPPHSADSCIPPNGTCLEGYEGPRCSVCSRGFGKTGVKCGKCESETIIILYMVLLVVITLVFVSLMVLTSFTTSMNDMLPVVIKIFINHLQVSARIQDIVFLPSALQYIFSFQVQLSELIRFDIVTTECPPLELTTYDKFYIAVSLPAVMMFLFGIIYFFLFVYRKATGAGPVYKDVSISTTEGKVIRRDRVMLLVAKFMAKCRGKAALYHGDLARDDLRKQFFTSKQYFASTCFIVLFLVYPSVLQWCVSMWSCDPIVYGDAENLHTIEYLKRDRSIDCGERKHWAVQIGSLTAALAYGLVVPAAAMIFIWQHWDEHGRVHARRLFAYLTLGFDVTTWWWESVVTLRKAAIVFILIFVNDTILRTYLAMWAMTLALGGHGWFQPYDPRHPSLYYLEGLAITSIVVTLNLSLLFQFEMFAEGTLYYNILVVLLVLINIIVLAVFVIFILRYAYLRFKRLCCSPPEEEGATEEGDDSATDNLSSHDDFVGVDRYNVQKEGVTGAVRRASMHSLGMKPDAPNSDPSVTAKHGKALDIRHIPKSDHETPLERIKRIEAERQREQKHDLHMNTQAELEKELEELRERMIRAQALAAAEEAVIERHPEIAELRARHEQELYRLMDEIRKERGDFAIGDAQIILKDDPAAIVPEHETRPKSAESTFEMNFEDDDENNNDN